MQTGGVAVVKFKGGSKADRKRSHKARAQPSAPGGVRLYAMPAPGFAPVKSARTDPENTGIAPDLSALATAKDVDIRRDMTKKITGARRKNAFDILRSTPRQPTQDNPSTTALERKHLQAVDRLSEDLAICTQTTGASSSGREPVDEARIKDPMDAVLQAGERLGVVLAYTGTSSAKLILALLDPYWLDVRKVDDDADEVHREALDDWHGMKSLYVGSRDPEMLAGLADLETKFPVRRASPTWREVVASVTGIAHPHAQSAPIIMACENLCGAYAAFDRGEIKARRRDVA